MERPGRIGDVAREIYADKNFPQNKTHYEEIKAYLNSLTACSAAIESFKEAWIEYMKQYPERIEPYAWV
ncbi:MAG: hypothetical protein JRJ49_04220 [Deltaproteobacteria bacterium]|nr:hypothetical protein [Deltaproteobacteria bacterium]